MKSVISLIVTVLAVSEAFSPASKSWGVSSRPAAATQRVSPAFMFFADEEKKAEPKALEVVDEASSSEATPEAEVEPAKPKMVAKNMNTGETKEVNFVDPAMAANTNPLVMSWWAYPLIGYPLVLLANDFFHFLPKSTVNIGEWIDILSK